MIKKSIFTLVVALATTSVLAQSTKSLFKWYNPEAEKAQIEGQAWRDEARECYYDRFPAKVKDSVRQAVWRLSNDNAGESIKFFTDAKTIKVRYTLSKDRQMWHMPAAGVSGLDLYAKGRNGNDIWFSGEYYWQDTVTAAFTNLDYRFSANGGYEYEMFLPLYNSVRYMEIGVPEGASFQFVPATAERPVVVYGTSIAQGACASRPAMAWSNIVKREMDIPVVNIGFSGNGRLERSVVETIATIDASAYIIDCMPNVMMHPREVIADTLYKAVIIIRKANPETPIILAEHDGYTDYLSNKDSHDSFVRSNLATKDVYKRLQAEGVKNIHLVTYEDIAMPLDGMVDGVHATDLGMSYYAKAYVKKLREVLNMPVGTMHTQIPTRQNRDAAIYDWNSRHEEILAYNKRVKPKNVVIGNSIMHFWGGAPTTVCTDSTSWRDAFGESSVNMGFGWDRIENVLWRVYHGELDGFRADNIFLAIGTNNLAAAPEESSDDEIIEGLRFLVEAIKSRQPDANITLSCIFPRGGDYGKRVKPLGDRYKRVAKALGVNVIDLYKVLSTKGGYNRELYKDDAVHLSAKGYKVAQPLLTLGAE